MAFISLSCSKPLWCFDLPDYIGTRTTTNAIMVINYRFKHSTLTVIKIKSIDLECLSNNIDLNPVLFANIQSACSSRLLKLHGKCLRHVFLIYDFPTNQKQYTGDF